MYFRSYLGVYRESPEVAKTPSAIIMPTTGAEMTMYLNSLSSFGVRYLQMLVSSV